MAMVTTGHRSRRAPVSPGQGGGGVGPGGRYTTLAGLGTFIGGNACASSADITAWGFGDASQVAFDATKTALKITFDGSGTSGPNYQMALGNRRWINLQKTSGTVLCGWDLWLDPTLRWHGQGGNRWVDTDYTWKGALMVRSNLVNPQIWSEDRIRSGSTTPSQYVGYYDSRQYASAVIPGVTAVQPYAPYGPSVATRPFYLPHGSWIRFVKQLSIVDESAFSTWNSTYGVTVSPAGTYVKMSEWICVDGVWSLLYNQTPISTWTPASTRTSIAYLSLAFATSTEHQVSTGTVTFTGTNGSVIPKDQWFYRVSDGRKYWTRAAGTITGGSVTVSCAAFNGSGGLVSNCAQGTSFQFSPSIPPVGVDSTATAATAFTGGLDLYSGDAYCWVRNVFALHNYSLAANPLDDTLIFEVP